MEMCLDDISCGNTSGNYPAVAATNNLITSLNLGTFLPTLPKDPGGGSTACNAAATSTNETAVQNYCGINTGVGTEYCIYARLSDGRIMAASKKGVSFMATLPAAASACP